MCLSVWDFGWKAIRDQRRAQWLCHMFFSFCDEIMIPSAGKKAKDISQSIFGQKVLCVDEFQGGGAIAWKPFNSKVCLYSRTSVWDFQGQMGQPRALERKGKSFRSI